MSTSLVTRQLRGVRPPPPGVVPNFQHPENQNANNIALHTIMLFFVTLAVAVRFYNRAVILHQVGLDDYFCGFAYILIITNSGLFLAAMSEGYLGYHIWEIIPSTFFMGRKIEIAAQSVYLPLAATIKLSVLITYRRIFAPNIKVRYLCYGGMAFIAAGYLSFFFVSIFTCVPVAKRVNPAIPGTCLPPGVSAYGSGALNVITDLFVVILPMPVLWRLNMNMTKKLKTMAIFGLGIVVVVLAIVRLALTPVIFTKYDGTWELSKFSIYSILELYIGMICSCIFTSTSFLDRYGTVFMNKLKSFSSLGRSSDRSSSKAASSHQSIRALRKTRSNGQMSMNGTDQNLFAGQGHSFQTTSFLPVPPVPSVPTPHLPQSADSV